MTHELLIDSLKELFEKAPKLDVTAARILLHENYTKKFGIANELKLQGRPLAPVAMFDEEDPLYGSLMEERMQDYYDLDIKDVFLMSWLDYIDLPRHEIVLMNEMARRFKKKSQAAQNKATGALEDDLRKAMSAGKSPG